MRRATYTDTFSGIRRAGWVEVPAEGDAARMVRFYADSGLVFVVNLYAELVFGP
jgi:hypothetical protein